MRQAGYDPYSTTEYTAGAFIESLKEHGFKTVTMADGDEFRVYNPKGYGETNTNDRFCETININDETDK
jgi:hypothetical protein